MTGPDIRRGARRGVSRRREANGADPNRPGANHPSVRISLAIAVVGVLFVLSLAVGAIPLSPGDVIEALIDADSPLRYIVVQHRLPRAAGAVVAGAALAVSGLLLQAALRNPLASPDVVGVSKGAGLGAVLAIMVLPGALVGFTPLFVVLGAFCAMALLLYASATAPSATRVALIGLAVGALFNAATTFVLVRTDGDTNQAAIWLSGSMYGTDMRSVGWLSLVLAAVFPLVFLGNGWLDIARLTDDTALGIGVNPKLVRAVIIVAGVVLAAAAVTVGGAITFLGLIAPHIAGGLVGHRPAAQLPGSMAVGASLLLLADLVGRILALPNEIPAGVVVTAIGVPYFIYLLWRQSSVQ